MTKNQAAKSAARMAREVCRNAVFRPDTRTKEERIAQLRKNIATVEARGPHSAGLAAFLREELTKVEAS